VLAFLLRQWRRAVAHLCYGLFKEKRWHVATAAADLTAPLDAILERLSQAAEWRQAATPPGYRFLADPFFHPEGGLLVEGFNERSCRGEILHVSETVVKRLSGRGGHYSYPATLRDGSQWTIIPEVSEWSPALSYALRDDALGQPAELHVAGRPLLLDPTPFSHDGRLYLFANRADEGPSVLRLWSAVNVGGEFVEHPDSPILISPRGARMAGHIFHLGGQLFRAGQDFSGRYGDGTCFFRIMHIDRHRYAEEPAADFRFDRCRGPHTLNFGDGRAAFDFYEEHFNLLAGLGRLKERRAAGRSD